VLAGLVFFGGAASLGAEIAAARLMAPYFGASTLVWANTIGVVLVALAGGHALGGRLADKHPDLEVLARTAVVAACGLAAIPFVSGPLLELAVPALDNIDAGAFVGSLLAVLVLLAFPILLLGMLTPWAVRLSITSVDGAGRVAGRLSALSTVGSLVGVFASALLLIPFIGTQRTFLVFAASLAGAGALAYGRRALVVPAALLGLLLLPPGVTKPEGEGDKLLYEAESAYQYIRVLERDGERSLELNEGQAVHSVYEADSVLTGLVFDGYLVAPFTVLERAPERLAMLGNAAGSVSRAYGRYFPETQIDGVEIDPRVTEAGERFFALRTSNPRLRVHSEDARPFLRQAEPGSYDVIAVDAYRQPYIPFYLTTREFFELARSRLRPGGVLIVNVGHVPDDDRLERSLTASIDTAFGDVIRWPIRQKNTLLIASDTPPTGERLGRVAVSLPEELGPLAAEAVNGLAEPLTGGPVYTDDRAPVEWLIDASILRYAGE